MLRRTWRTLLLRTLLVVVATVSLVYTVLLVGRTLAPNYYDSRVNDRFWIEAFSPLADVPPWGGPAKPPQQAALPVPSRAPVQRDCQGRGLVRLLNTPGLVDWDAMEAYAQEGQTSDPERHRAAYAQFIDALTPWVIGEPAVPPNERAFIVRAARLRALLNCTQPRYGHLFTGRRRRVPRFLVDIFPFGYNLDVLEMRLREVYHAVDAIVVYEAPYTQKGIPKPLFFNISRQQNPRRWQPFLAKLVHVVGHPQDVAEELALQHGPKEDWGLEYSMRKVHLRRIKHHRQDMDPASRAVAERILQAAQSDPDALILTSDDDEIVLDHVLFHVKHCETRSSVTLPIHAPAINFKKNVQWCLPFRKRNLPDGCLNDARNFPPSLLEELRSLVWGFRPLLMSLATALDREDVTGPSPMVCESHLGIPAAMHLSSMAEPVMQWLKEGGLIELAVPAFPAEFVAAGKARAMTPALIARAGLRPDCSWKAVETHVSSFTSAAQDMIRDAIPYALTSNSQRFCWMDPQLNTMGEVTMDPGWAVGVCPTLSVYQLFRRLVTEANLGPARPLIKT
jgi:hypothetical protein